MKNDIKLEKWKISGNSADVFDDFIESVVFSGNGRMGARGYLALEHGAPPYKTGIFVAGVFGELKKGITDFVNLPTPFYFRLNCDGKSAKELPTNINRSLDLHGGLLSSQYDLSFGDKSVEVIEERFFSLANTGLAVERVVITPHEDMQIDIFSGIRTECCNFPINDDQTKENNETVNLISIKNKTFSDNKLCAEFKTHGTDIKICETMTLRPQNTKIVENCDEKKSAGFKMSSFGRANVPIIIEKSIFISTSRDVDHLIVPPKEEKSFDTLYFENVSQWNKRWETANIELKGNKDEDAALRYVIFELIANDSAHDPTVSIGARGLTHARYKGCYFWDTDFFMLPFYLYSYPEAAKNLVDYRFRTLPQAKEHAKKMNGKGARYPWMTSFDGSEQCESWDIGASEVHITADVVFAINNYIKATGDTQFYKNKAVDVYIETARFWLSRYTPEEGTDKVNLLFCKGPDEYCGITENNLFTNVLVKENLSLAIEAAEYLKENDIEKYESLGISEKEVESFKHFRSGIKFPRDKETGHYKQDDTFSLLEPIQVEDLKEGYAASYRSVCFDRVQRYRVIKQADVILLMTRFKNRFTKQEKMEAWKDFEPVCLHDSTLSFATHALFAAQNGIMEAAQDYFQKALFLDLRDIMENTGGEGLHTACLGESWQSVVFGFAGLSFENGKPKFTPNLPKDISEIDFCFFYQGVKYKAAVRNDSYILSVVS